MTVVYRCLGYRYGLIPYRRSKATRSFLDHMSARVNLSAAVTLVLNKSDYRRKYETGGGIVYDYSHEIDYMRYFFGEIKRYACFKDLLVKKGFRPVRTGG